MHRRLLRLAGLIVVTGLLQACGNARGPQYGTAHPEITAAAAAAQKAAADFTTIASSYQGVAPRQDAPGVKPLLDVVLDTQVLHRTPPNGPDIKALGDWLKAVADVLRVYQMSGTGLTPQQLGTEPAKTFSVLSLITENARHYPAEFGRLVDGAELLSQAMAESTSAIERVNPAAFANPEKAKGIATLRESVVGELANSLGLLQLPGFDDQWRRDRLAVIVGYAPVVKPYISAVDRSALHRFTLDLIRCQRDAVLQANLTQLAASLSDTLAPRTPEAQAAHDRLIDADCRAQDAVVAFEIKALPARTGAPMPRQSDPRIKALLDAILDPGIIPADPTPDDVRPLIDRESAVLKVYFDYLYVDTGLVGPRAYEPDLKDPVVTHDVEQNIAKYQVEFGRAADAQARLMTPIATAVAISFRANSPTALTEQQRTSFDQFRNSIGLMTKSMLGGIETTHLSDAWRRERLSALEALVPAAAAILRPADATALRNQALQFAKTEHDPECRAKLQRIVAALPV